MTNLSGIINNLAILFRLQIIAQGEKKNLRIYINNFKCMQFILILIFLSLRL